MTWANPESDLRTSLSDNAADKLRYRKRVFGECNGVNTSFKTFEFRRITDFTSVTAPLGVWVNGSLLSGGVTTDFKSSGDFVLTTAPSDGDVVEASYYIQWFTDTEIQDFLRIACNWLNLGDTYANVEGGLRPCVLKYAAAEAYQKLSLRWAEHLSEGFLLNDAPDEKRMAIIDVYAKQSKIFRDDAGSLRKAFYTRNDQNQQPLFGNISGSVQDNVPKR